MPFAAALRESLEIRGSLIPSEFTRGDGLERVLERYLLTVEQNFDGEIVTSILLLSNDGKRLSHGAGPNLPLSYRDAIDGSAIGPCAGSCGTAAYLGRPIYVADIASDPLWADYRHLALPHGFQSCWSTPIRSDAGALIGTFATYHRVPSDPTPEEIDAIAVITDHVAHAIMWDRGLQDLSPRTAAPRLRLVESGTKDSVSPGWPNRLLVQLEKLESLVRELDQSAESAETDQSKEALKEAAADSRRLISAIRQQFAASGLSQ